MKSDQHVWLRGLHTDCSVFVYYFYFFFFFALLILQILVWFLVRLFAYLKIVISLVIIYAENSLSEYLKLFTSRFQQLYLNMRCLESCQNCFCTF